MLRGSGWLDNGKGLPGLPAMLYARPCAVAPVSPLDVANDRGEVLSCIAPRVSTAFGPVGRCCGSCFGRAPSLMTPPVSENARFPAPGALTYTRAWLLVAAALWGVPWIVLGFRPNQVAVRYRHRVLLVGRICAEPPTAERSLQRLRRSLTASVAPGLSVVQVTLVKGFVHGLKEEA